MNPTNPTSQMNPKNSTNSVLVTGGAGFIGSHLCERLLSLSDLGHRTSDLGPSVICLDNFNDFYDPAIKEQNLSRIKDNPNFTLIRGDILDVQLLDNIFSGNIQELTANSHLLNANTQDLRPKVVVHLAAMAGVRPSLVSPAKYVDVDIKGTLNLLEMSKEYEIDQFIFGSSSSVYGVNKKIPFSEEDPTDNQISPYATAKKSAELYCKTYHHLYHIPTTILRVFTVYGPRQRPEMAIHKFTGLMTQGKPIPMYGDGTSERDYTYIDDCIDGIISAIKNPFDFEIFNLGNSETVKLRALIDLEETMTFKHGEMLVRFPRADLRTGKYRPVLLLSKMPGPFDDWLICAITSQLRHEIKDWDQRIEKTDDDVKSSGLKAPSLIRIGKLAPVEEKVFEGALGNIPPEGLKRILNKLNDHFQ